MRKKKIPILRLHYSTSEKRNISKGISGILNSGNLTMSKKVFQFEKLFAKYVGTKYAVAVNSGTSALEISLKINLFSFFEYFIRKIGIFFFFI